MNDKPARIMIVSNALDNNALWKLIQKSGDAIWSVQGALSALKRLKEIDYEIDAIVMDLALDDLDGIGLTEQIRRNESIRSKVQGALIFWMSGHTINPTILRAKVELSVMEIFLAPINPESLLAKVKAYLQPAAAAHRAT